MNYRVYSLGSWEQETAEVRHTGSPVIFEIFYSFTFIKNKYSFTYFVEILWVTFFL